jgi:AcrR family transcriptional regulator
VSESDRVVKILATSGHPPALDLSLTQAATRETESMAARDAAKGEATAGSDPSETPSAVVSHPLDELAPAARSMVEAATRVLMREGANGVTFRAVADEAGVYADSIRYYFGGKKGLLEAVSLNASHDLSVVLMDSLSGARGGDERLRALADVMSRLAEDTSGYRVWWSLVPQILADPEWTAREAADYEWARRLYAQSFPRQPAEFEEFPDPQRARNLTALMVAVVDGLAFQKAIDPDSVDLEAIIALWTELLQPVLESTLERSADR